MNINHRLPDDIGQALPDDINLDGSGPAEPVPSVCPVVIFGSARIDPPHYNRHAIEPIDFIMANDLPFWAANVIKYVVRADAKGDETGDLEKAKRYIDFRLMQLRGERFCKENYKA